MINPSDRSQRGQTLLEGVIVLPLFLLLGIGGALVTLFFVAKLLLSHAGYEYAICRLEGQDKTFCTNEMNSRTVLVGHWIHDLRVRDSGDRDSRKVDVSARFGTTKHSISVQETVNLTLKSSK